MQSLGGEGSEEGGGEGGGEGGSKAAMQQVSRKPEQDELIWRSSSHYRGYVV